MSKTRIQSEIRGPGLISPVARLEYRALEPGQFLTLEREHGNAVDGNAVIAKTSLGQPCGYIAKEHAKVIAPDMDRGLLWRCQVTGRPRAMQYPKVVLFRQRGQKYRKATGGT